MSNTNLYFFFFHQIPYVPDMALEPSHHGMACTKSPKSFKLSINFLIFFFLHSSPTTIILITYTNVRRRWKLLYLVKIWSMAT